NGMNLSQLNLRVRLGEPRRGSVTEPRVAAKPLPWVTAPFFLTTPTGLRKPAFRNPVGVAIPRFGVPRVAPSAQPWALLRNPIRGSGPDVDCPGPADRCSMTDFLDPQFLPMSTVQCLNEQSPLQCRGSFSLS